MSFVQTPDILRSCLLPGERILWIGQPKQGIALSARDFLLIPFSLLWGGFALFWNVTVWTFPGTSNGPDWFLRLWGLPFLIVGMYITVGRFFQDSYLRKSLIYAVTDQRVIVARGSRLTKIKSLDLHHLPKLELSEHRDGTGTIAFDSDGSFFGSSRMNGFSWCIPAMSGSIQFFRINDPRKIYDLVRTQSRS